ncbi:MAG: hypothetical protein ACFFDW_16440 [Candidatus Thorarchaeota archaeon]
MNGKKKNEKKIDIKTLKEHVIGGEGISEVEEKRHKFEEKFAVKYEIDSEKREELNQKITQGLEIKTDKKDLLIFLLSQFLPLILLSSGLFIPGIIFLTKDIYFVILIILGSLGYFYASVRLISTITYRIKISITEIRWHNCFWWNVIPNSNIQEVVPKNGYFFYFTKIGGVGRFGVEVIQIVSKENEYWIRGYPLSKEKADELVLTIKCWSDIIE